MGATNGDWNGVPWADHAPLTWYALDDAFNVGSQVWSAAQERFTVARPRNSTDPGGFSVSGLAFAGYTNFVTFWTNGAGQVYPVTNRQILTTALTQSCVLAHYYAFGGSNDSPLWITNPCPYTVSNGLDLISATARFDYVRTMVAEVDGQICYDWSDSESEYSPIQWFVDATFADGTNPYFGAWFSNTVAGTGPTGFPLTCGRAVFADAGVGWSAPWATNAWGERSDPGNTRYFWYSRSFGTNVPQVLAEYHYTTGRTWRPWLGGVFPSVQKIVGGTAVVELVAGDPTNAVIPLTLVFTGDVATTSTPTGILTPVLETIAATNGVNLSTSDWVRIRGLNITPTGPATNITPGDVVRLSRIGFELFDDAPAAANRGVWSARDFDERYRVLAALKWTAADSAARGTNAELGTWQWSGHGWAEAATNRTLFAAGNPTPFAWLQSAQIPTNFYFDPAVPLGGGSYQVDGHIEGVSRTFGTWTYRVGATNESVGWSISNNTTSVFTVVWTVESGFEPGVPRWTETNTIGTGAVASGTLTGPGGYWDEYGPTFSHYWILNCTSGVGILTSVDLDAFTPRPAVNAQRGCGAFGPEYLLDRPWQYAVSNEAPPVVADLYARGEQVFGDTGMVWDTEGIIGIENMATDIVRYVWTSGTQDYFAVVWTNAVLTNAPFEDQYVNGRGWSFQADARPWLMRWRFRFQGDGPQ